MYGPTVLSYEAITGASHATTSCSGYQATEIIICTSTITQCWQGIFPLLIYVYYAVCRYVCMLCVVCMYVLCVCMCCLASICMCL